MTGDQAGAPDRWRRKESRGYAVRKILKAASALKAVLVAATISGVMAALGIALYLMVFPSDVVLVEAFVWLIEAISFSSLAVAFYIAASRTIRQRERFEILRVEALTVLHVAVAGLAVTGFVVAKSLFTQGKEVTPLPLSLYPLLSALISYVMEKVLHSQLHRLEVRLVSVRFVAEKLKLDVALEAAGGLAIIASNLTGSRLFEIALVVSVGLYVIYSLGSIAIHNLLYLVGPGPRSERERVRRSIVTVVEGLGYKVKGVRVESYGTFAEAEVWVEYPRTATLIEAYREARSIARELVHNVPELLRSVVVMVPSRVRTVKRYKRKPQVAVSQDSSGTTQNISDEGEDEGSQR